ncbi:MULTISPECIES: LysR family transcriptional regulator [Serratia]|uniref:LysR family transcriptional regulator n=1 Tax=Serratia TaxID=613 RepID=UPI00093B65AD|nr:MULTISPECIES: LysR family transcriptional regulator [Serratia]OKP26148.1 LysR family transcriptional regulator [Serratia fonticola]CAI2071522.1 D-malate degradation protein R [Serratia fonticola]
MSSLLQLLPFFDAVAKLGSFTQAANHLGVTPPAVSQNVRALEALLGVRLFNRTSRSVRLSDEGLAFYEQIAPAMGQIEVAAENASSQRGEPSGLLRITLPQLAASMLVMPYLPEFHARYPELKLELFTDDRFADLVLDNFDAGIRMQRMLQKDMVAVPIDQGQQHVIVASPGYLAQHGQPETPQELQQHDCMRYRFPGSGKLEPWYFSNGTEQLTLEVNGRLIFNENQLLKDAAIAGLGLTQRFRAAVHQELQSGQLREVLQDFSNVAPGFFIYFPAGRHMPLKLRAFIDFMREKRERQIKPIRA